MAKIILHPKTCLAICAQEECPLYNNKKITCEECRYVVHFVDKELEYLVWWSLQFTGAIYKHYAQGKSGMDGNRWGRANLTKLFKENIRKHPASLGMYSGLIPTLRSQSKRLRPIFAKKQVPWNDDSRFHSKSYKEVPYKETIIGYKEKRIQKYNPLKNKYEYEMEKTPIVETIWHPPDSELILKTDSWMVHQFHRYLNYIINLMSGKSIL